MIILARHGQAAWGTRDYDRLTETGTRQAQLLGLAPGLEGGLVQPHQARFEAQGVHHLGGHRIALTGAVLLQEIPDARGQGPVLHQLPVIRVQLDDCHFDSPIDVRTGHSGR